MPEEETQKLVDSLREAAEVRSQVSSISHELRAPIASVHGYLGALLAGDAGELNAEQREYAEIALRNLGRLQALIDDLLTISRIDAGRMRLEPKPFDVAQTVRELAEDLEPLARDGGIRLVVQAPPRLGVTGDRLRLVQAFTNLVTNAIKYSPHGGDVQVRLFAQGAEAVLEVVDSGVGIPRDELARISERFFRASTAGKVKGSGLGLAISREIVERHGGRLEVESEEAAGSTFRVRLGAQQDG